MRAARCGEGCEAAVRAGFRAVVRPLLHWMIHTLGIGWTLGGVAALAVIAMLIKVWSDEH